jgi:hypothetical protein
MVGNPAYRAPVQRSNIHANGEGLSGDAQLRHQGNVHKTHIGPESMSIWRDLDWSPHIKVVWRMGRVGEEATLSLRPTRVLIPTNELGLLMGQVDT